MSTPLAMPSTFAPEQETVGPGSSPAPSSNLKSVLLCPVSFRGCGPSQALACWRQGGSHLPPQCREAAKPRLCPLGEGLPGLPIALFTSHHHAVLLQASTSCVNCTSLTV